VSQEKIMFPSQDPPTKPFPLPKWKLRCVVFYGRDRGRPQAVNQFTLVHIAWRVFALARYQVWVRV
jgi:hypothetical protein